MSEGLTLWRELAVAARLSSGMSTRVSHFTADEIPPFPQALEGADHIILVGNEIAESPTALQTLRAFVQSGGRLWIPLDIVNLHTVSLLLGDTARIAEIDRTDLTTVDIRNVSKNVESGPERSFDEPVNLVRVLVSGAVVSHNVDRWPAAFRIDVGQGRVMFTTLDAHGWMRPRGPGDRPSEPDRDSKYVAVPALQQVAAQFTRTLDPPPFSPEDWEPFLLEQVGYRILGRGSVLTILSLYCLALIGLGTMLQRSARLDRLVWVGPLAAACAAVPLVALGASLRRFVPPSVTTVEVVHVEPDATTTHAVGLSAVYVPDKSIVPVSARRDRLTILRRDRTDGVVCQMVWTDLDAWSWDQLELSSGLHFGMARQHLTLREDVRATATFDGNGLRGMLGTGPWEAPTDAVIVTRTRHSIAPRLSSDGQYSAGRADVLPPESYIATALLEDVQRRRAAVLKRMLGARRGSRYPGRPMFLVWTKPRVPATDYPNWMQHSHSTLLAIPLDIRSPGPDKIVFLPSPFLHFETVADAAGNVATAFDNRTCQWSKSSSPTDALLRFQIPPALTPLEPEFARLSLSLQALGWMVWLSTGSAQTPVSLPQLENPVGPVDFEIRKPAALQIDESGGLYLRLQVDDLRTESTAAAETEQIDRSWKLDYISLELTGRTVGGSD